MEGYLSKWTNYVYGWKKRYFILHAGVLHYCKDKGTQQKGAIHLDVAQIIPHSDLKRMAIDTGCTIIHLRAYSDEEGRMWRKALGEAKEELGQENSNRELRTSEHTQGLLQNDLARLTLISDKLGELWSTQAQLEASIDLLPNSAKLTHPMSSIVSLAHQFKYMMAETLSLLEEESANCRQLNKALEDKLMSWSNGPDNIDVPLSPRAKEYRVPDEQSDFEFHDAKSDQSDDMFHESTDKVEKPEVIEGSFSILTEDSMPHRKCLPVLRNPKQKINIWKVVRDTIGKDLSRIAVPGKI
jgi:oxysterol-binding protein 1